MRGLPRIFLERKKNSSKGLFKKKLSTQAKNFEKIIVQVGNVTVPTEENEYISSLSRGALWAPHSWLISIAEIAELCLKKHTRTGKPSLLPVDKVVEAVQASPRAKSLWNNIVEQCDVQVTKECQSLCFENIAKLYATVRGFSFARDIVNKYKLCGKNTEKEGFAETVEGRQ